MARDFSIRPVLTKADRKAFVDLPFRLYKDNPAWVPPLKDEAMGLITPGKNPFFEHAVAQLFLAERGGIVVGRISASIARSTSSVVRPAARTVPTSGSAMVPASETRNSPVSRGSLNAVTRI